MRITMPPGGQPVDWYAHLRAGRCYSFGDGQTNIVGEYAHIQLFNPASSGVRILVRQISIITDTAQSLYISRYNTVLGVAGVAWRALLLGNADGNGVVRATTNPSILGSSIYRVQLAGNAVFTTPFEWVCEVPENDGVLVRCGTANTTLIASFAGVEIPL